MSKEIKACLLLNIFDRNIISFMEVSQSIKNNFQMQHEKNILFSTYLIIPLKTKICSEQDWLETEKFCEQLLTIHLEVQKIAIRVLATTYRWIVQFPFVLEG